MAEPGKYTFKYIPVLHDVFDISGRIREIDDTYFILYNKLKNKFEVHSSAQKGDSFCVELPFSFLDARTLVYLRRYRGQRAQEIFLEMEKDNKTANQRLLNNARDNLGAAFENFERRKRK